MPLRTEAAQVWQAHDHYSSMTSYARKRGLLRPARLLLGSVCLALSVAAFCSAASAMGPTSQWRVASLVAGFIPLAVGVGYFIRWPSQGQSAAIVIALSAAISVESLAQSDPLIAMIGLSPFSAVAGYAATMHSPRACAVVVAVAWIMIGTIFITSFGDRDLAIAIAVGICVLISTFTLPLVLAILIPAMHIGAQNSDTDHLTGLPNRRGFEATTQRAIHAEGRHHTITLSVLMIDLDQFKSLNDTFGHAAGDAMLRHVGAILLAGERGEMCGRVGGEEFIAAYIGPADYARELADHYLRAIADNEWQSTASIGLSTAEFTPTEVGDAELLTARATTLGLAADREMYRAKRAGGNRVSAIELP